MNWDNRSFSNTDLKTPELTDSDATLFKGLTQERVDMLNAVKHESEQRIKRDDELLEEMHSFGMVECDIFDEDIKRIKITFSSNESLELKCFSTATTSWNLADATVIVPIQKGTILWLDPVGFAKSSGKTMVGAVGHRQISGKELYFTITYSELFLNKISFALSGAFAEGKVFHVPNGSATATEISIDLSDITAYK